jgi:CHASE3 domain sensor protein
MEDLCHNADVSKSISENMTKEQVVEFYNTYQEADYAFHKYMDQFFTTAMNRAVLNQATKGMDQQEQEKIETMDKEVSKARIAYEEAFKNWSATF